MHEVLKLTDDCIDWLKYNKVHVAPPSRLYVYRQIVSSLAGETGVENKPEGIFALLNLQQFVGVYQAFCTENLDEKIVATLQDAVTGPPFLQHESSKNSDPRNKLFELRIAALLKAANLKPHFREPDIVVSYRNSVALLACKRVRSENSLRDNVKKGIDQINGVVNSGFRNHLGFVALDTTELANPDHKWFEGPDADEQSFSALQKQMLSRFKKLRTRIDMKRCDLSWGFIGYQAVPCVIPNPSSSTETKVIEQVIAIPCNCKSDDDAEIFNNLTSTLSRTLHGYSHRN